MRFEKRSILNAKEYYICHVCDCTSVMPYELSRHLFDLYPHANTYETRTKPARMGTIDMIESNGKCIVNMYCHYYQGKGSSKKFYEFGTTGKDNIGTREMAFKYGLSILSKRIKEEESLAFPDYIEIDYGKYIYILKQFEKDINAEVVIYEDPYAQRS